MRNRFLGLTVVALVSVACGPGGWPSPSAPSALVQPANIAGFSTTMVAPAGTGGVVDLQFNAPASAFELTADILRGAVEASPNADFRLSSKIEGDGLIVTGGCPIADTKPISETAGTARVQQSLPYDGAAGTFNVTVTTQVTKGDGTKIGNAVTGSFTVTVPPR